MTSMLSKETLDKASGTVGGLPGKARKGFAAARRRTKVVIAGGLIVLLALVAGGVTWWQIEALPDDAAFRLGDRVVTTDELDRQVDTLRALYGVNPPTEPDQLDAFRRDAAKSYAVAIVLDDAARDEGVVAADKAVNDTLSRFIAQQLGEGPQAREKFIEALGNSGTSEQAVLGEVKRQMTVAQLMDKVTGPITVSDDEVKKAFDERHDQLGTPEKRRLSNIVVADRAAADQVVARIRGGEPFADVARSVSQDQSTRDKGGDLGQVAAAQLEPAYGQAAFAAAPGTVFGPVQTQHGWNVGVGGATTPPVPATFEAIKEPLRATLELEKSTEAWRNWIATRITDADVEYADNYRPADPDAPPGVADPAPAGPAPQGGAPAPQGGAPAPPAVEPPR
ncbi:peptidyl-prolyl cis-trans isomerase [Pseudonocardia endophytica]|uniref:Peptidyl-prolyl cis-trans isomerase C n=1 Tax=Pseudonocardia endophytica TaxID=401976 RepID=A0A4V2PIX0_PSEEN|nr:peptidylprolyl isomerase [Pseudonocardia endophytica]TCK26276.1 peptidyl-prolyl cis-trans isomerase C [Pseudonocardia endophytica]